MRRSNDGLLDPEEGILLISARKEDISIEPGDLQGWVSIGIANFKGGIEIVNREDRIWRPA